jgi:hypothetical protein
MIDSESFSRARFDLVRSLAMLTMEPVGDSTLAARNLAYHAEELCRWIDIYYSGRDPDNPEGTEAGDP